MIIQEEEPRKNGHTAFEQDRERMEILRPLRFYPPEMKPKWEPKSSRLLRPKPASGRVISRAELENLKDIVDRMVFVVDDHENDLDRLRRKIAIIETRLRERSTRIRLNVKSNENVKQLREMFGLPLVERVEENVLADMLGMFEEYQEEGVDSLELLRRAREE